MQNPAGKSALGLDVNVASLLAYIPVCLVGVIISIIIIVTDKTNTTARFNAFQSLLLHAIFIVCYIAVVFVMMLGGMASSTLLVSLGGLLWFVVLVGFIGLFIFCMVKAYGGGIFKLPVIGDMAQKWANG
jgi:uncharacterized membrane protein